MKSNRGLRFVYERVKGYDKFRILFLQLQRTL
jgi:hypothetical protein